MTREKDHRDLQIFPVSVQPGLERFPDGNHPAVADGRNNLTAISPEHNLYFVAEQNKIRVYRPTFPDQHLRDPLHKWTLPVSKPGMPGYLDPRYPHAVNAMLIERLGTEEVFLCACDDGDVLLYYTRKLKSVVDCPGKISEKPTVPLALIHNVGKSAWGLAVHRNARKIAISSNLHDVTILALGLTDDSILYDNPDIEWQYPGRSKDISLNLSGHEFNIPSVAFFNSDLDREGRLLISTDLRGRIIIWDLREKTKVKVVEPLASSIHRDPRSGWSVACLDPSSFLMFKIYADFLGCKEIRDSYGTYDITQARTTLKDSSIHYPQALPRGINSSDPRFFDQIRQQVAETRNHLLNLLNARDANQAITAQDDEMLEEASNLNAAAMQHQLHVEDEANLELDLVNEEDDDDDIDYEDDDDLEDMDQEEVSDNFLLQFDVEVNRPMDRPSTQADPGDTRETDFEHALRSLTAVPDIAQYMPPEIVEEEEAPLTEDRGSLEQPGEVMDAESVSTTSHDELEDQDTNLEDADNPNRQAHDLSEEDDAESLLRSSTDSHHSDIFGEDENLGLAAGSDTHNDRADEVSTAFGPAMDAEDVPFLLLHTGRDFVSLQEAPFRYLSLISRDPCHQHLPREMQWLQHSDRLHLSQIVPELNLVIIGTSTGRVALYTMTRKLTVTPNRVKDEYGLRLDYIVPFTSQEKRRERPNHILIGIAAAPLQGYKVRSGMMPQEQRWRLLLTYHDHTVLAYELSRGGNHSLSIGWA